MSRYCLDTSAYSHFQRGHQGACDIIDEAQWLGLPSVVIGELWLGFNLGFHLAKNQALLAAFLANPTVPKIVVDDQVARLYGELSAELRRQGTPIPTNGLWIAACAAATHSVIVTFDDHFRHVKRVGRVLLG